MEEIRIDVTKEGPEAKELAAHYARLIHDFNYSTPFSAREKELLMQIFENRIGKNSVVRSPITMIAPQNVTIGKNVTIMPRCLLMGSGTITIEDEVRIAPDVRILSNNHDPYNRNIITCKPVRICHGAWIGAGSYILPGVTVGKYAIVGAASVVTHDVEEYTVVAGSPARVVKHLDPNLFPKML